MLNDQYTNHTKRGARFKRFERKMRLYGITFAFIQIIFQT
jgi:hypothetical protein